MLSIGIAGGTGSGKTSVARQVITNLGPENAALISQDNYYLDHSHLPMSERETINYDHPLAFDHELLLSQLEQLKQGRAVETPLYDFAIHGRSGKTVVVEPTQVVIIEGLHVLSEETVRNMLDIKVFVDTDNDVRILRRVLRDIHERGRTIQSIYDQYLKTVKPMHDAFIEPSKKIRGHHHT